MSHWFVIQTAPQREFKAAEALRDLGYTTFLPAVVHEPRASRHTKRARQRVEPLFPRYIFVHRHIPYRECDSRDERCIRDKSGRRLLTGPVTICGVCEPIPEQVIGKLDRAVKEIESNMRKVPRGLRVGDIGVIKSGPFEGKSGEVVAVTGSDAEIAMKIFGAVRTVRARLDALEAA